MNKFNLIILLLSLSFASSTLFGQKIKDKSIKVKTIKLPKKVLPDEYTTYSVVTGGPLVSRHPDPVAFEKGFGIEGFKQLEGPDNVGHIRINGYMGEMRIGRPELKTKTTTSKKKDGTEVKTTTYYYEFFYSASGNYKVYDLEGKELEGSSVRAEYTYATDHERSTVTLKKKLARYANEFDNTFISYACNVMRGEVNDAMRDYAYKSEVHREEIYWIKKHPSEDRWLKHYKEVLNVFKEAKATTPSTELIAQLTPAMEFYKKHANVRAGTDKKKKRIFRAANYNLALLSFYTDQYDDARMYADRVIVSEGRDGKSKGLLKDLEKQLERGKLNGKMTLHYHRDLSNVMAPSDIANLEAQKEEIMEDNNVTDGTVFIGNTEIKGTVTLDKAASDIIFGDGGNIKFVTEQDNEIKEIDLTNSDVSAFKIADRSFTKMRFKPSAKGEQEAAVHILELIYESPQIKLYKYFPSSGALSDEKPEFAFLRKGKEEPISLESTQFLIWKKGIANFFESCPDLKEMCEAGEIKKNKEDLIKAARIYSELCADIIKP